MESRFRLYAKNLTLGEYLNRWLSDSVRASVKIRTYDDYEYVVRCHVVPELSRVKLKDLTAALARKLTTTEDHAVKER